MILSYTTKLIGVFFFAVFMAYVSEILNQEDSIEELTEVQFTKLSSLMARIERANSQKSMKKDYQKKIGKFFKDRFRFNYCDISEEEFLSKLKP